MKLLLVFPVSAMVWAAGLAAPAQEVTPAGVPAATAPAPAATVTVSTGTLPVQPEDPAVAQMRAELARLNLEKDRLTAENAIAKERLVKELAERRAVLERAELILEEERKKVSRDTESARLKAEREMAALKAENDRLTLEMGIAKNRAELRMTELRLNEAEAKSESVRLTSQMEQRDKELAAAQYAERAPEYADEPLNGRTLTLSDRRIALNGMILAGTADEICNRLDYFNNKDPKKPIFIVIDNSPGGSVMAGYRILKAMNSSKAPVHVIVKSFAASMAACITTLADRSYAYPNAVILHHQLSAGGFGNLQQQRESLAEYEEWWKRLAGPVAKKMGISLEDFEKRMYARVSTGDWTEFADKAVELKWVNHLVDEIRETGMVKHPDLVRSSVPAAPPVVPVRSAGESVTMVEQTDEKGKPFMILPRLSPKDCYWVCNSDGYYRLP